jgi:hypothetical protein
MKKIWNKVASIALLVTSVLSLACSCAGGNKAAYPDYFNSAENIKMYAFYGPGDGKYRDGKPMGDGTDMRTKERYQEYKDCGFDILLLENEAAYRGEDWETSKVKEIMDIAFEVGLDVVVFDFRIWQLAVKGGTLIGQTIGTKTIYTQEDINEVVAGYMKNYSKHPAYYGVYIVDEPNENQFNTFMECAEAVQACRADSFVHGCMLGYASEEKYAMQYKNRNIKNMGMDSYLWLFQKDQGVPYSVIHDGWFEKFHEYALFCTNNDIALSATTLQTFGSYEVFNGAGGYGWRPQNLEEVRYQMYASLAFAPEYLVYHHYWQSRYGYAEGTIMDDYCNKLIYDEVQALNKETEEIRRVLGNFDYKGLHFYSEKRKLPYYYQIDNSYEIKGIECTKPKNETMITELYDEKKDYTAYMLMNTTDPSEDKTSTLTVKFEGCNYAVFYEKGTARIVKLRGGKYTFNLESTEGCLVLPY